MAAAAEPLHKKNKSNFQMEPRNNYYWSWKTVRIPSVILTLLPLLHPGLFSPVCAAEAASGCECVGSQSGVERLSELVGVGAELQVLLAGICRDGRVSV